MPIAILKQQQSKVEESVQVLEESESLTDEMLADRYADLKTKVEALKKDPAFTQFAEVEKELLKRLKEDLEPTDAAEIAGDRWVLEIAPCSRNARKIAQSKMGQLAKTLGEPLFFKLAKLTMKDMEQYVGKVVIEQFLEPDPGYSDTRKIAIKKRS